MNRNAGPLRVVHIFGVMDVGGAELRTIELLREMSHTGHEFCFVTLSGRRGSLADEIEALGGIVRPIALGWLFPFRFAELLFRYRPTVLDSHVATFSGALCFIAAVCRVPVRIAHFHSDGDGQADSWRRSLQRVSMVLLIRAFATRVVGVSPSALSSGFSRSWGASTRSVLIPNGTDVSRLWEGVRDLRGDLGLDESDVLLVHAGRPSPEKNRSRLPGILRALVDRGMQAHLVLVGSRDALDDQLVMAAGVDVGVLERIHFMGPSSEVGAIMRGADALVLPSTREGLPGVVVESAAVGTPVVASALGGARWIADQLPCVTCVGLSESDDVWAEAIIAAIADAPDRTAARMDAEASVLSLSASLTSHLRLYAGGYGPTERRDTEGKAENLLVTTEAHFMRGPDGAIRTDAGNCSYPAWTHYHAVADQVLVVGRVSAVDHMNGLDVEGPGVRVVPVPGYAGLVGTALSPPASYGALRRVASRKKTVFVVRLPSIVGTLMILALRLRRRQYAVEVIGDPYDVLRSGIVPLIWGRPLSYIFLWLMRWQCANATVANYVTRETLQRRYPAKRASFVSNFSDVDLDESAFRPPPLDRQLGNPTILVTVGTTSQPYKGHHILIEAVRILSAGGSHVHLRVVGDGRLKDRLKQQAHRAGIGDRIDFVGQLPREGVAAELDAADLFVLPSLTEGLPRALIEAMARGLPAIASGVGGVNELLDARDVVLPGDAHALASSINELLNDPARSRETAVRNYARARKYMDSQVAMARSDFLRNLGLLAGQRSER